MTIKLKTKKRTVFRNTNKKYNLEVMQVDFFVIEYNYVNLKENLE